MEIKNFVWRDRRRPFLGLPWSFTVYTLLEDKLLIDSGLFSTVQEEIKLYRIIDLTLSRSLVQRIFGLGTIHIASADKTASEIDIKDIRNSFEVKEKLSKMVEEERQKKRVVGSEFFTSK